MNYDEKLYNVSKKAFRKNEGNSFNTITKEESETIKKSKIRLLKILTGKFHAIAKNEVTMPSKLHIRIKKSKYESKADPGYNDIKYLLENDEFASFSEDYLIYLTGLSYEEGNSYFDIVWDYKRYYLMTLPLHYEKQITDTANTLADEITKLILQ